MRFEPLHKVVTYLYASLGLAALAIGAELGPTLFALLILGTMISVFVEGRFLFRLGASRFWSVAAVLVFAVQIARGFAGDAVFQLGMEYAAFLQITRLCDRRTATEHLHVAGLAFLHLIIGAVLANGLDFAFLFLGFVITTPWMLSLTHLRGEMERRYGPPIDADGLPSQTVARALSSRDIAGKGFLFGSSLLALPLVLVTATFFLLFPRVGIGFLTSGENRGARVAGFGSDVDLSGFGTIRDDPTVVVRLFPAHLPESPPLDGSYRLRGVAFESYDGTRWTRSAGERPEVETLAGPLRLVPGRARTSLERHRLLVEPLEDAVFFLPEGTVALEVPPRIEAGFDRPRRVEIRRGIDVRVLEPDGLDLDYAVDVDPRYSGLPEALGDAERRRLTEIPRGYDRVIDLAGRIVGDAPDTRTEVARLVAALRDSGAYQYSLTVDDPKGADPLERFLFETHRGHCEFFSTALAVMLRTRGIPARNVSGFLGGRYNSYGHYYALRQGDAHSWVEAWIDGEWTTLDATPAARDEFSTDGGVFAALREIADALRTRWARDVVGYDMRAQITLFQRVRELFRGMGGSHESDASRASTSASASSRMLRWVEASAIHMLVVLGGLAIVVGLATVVRRRRRARRPRRGAAERLYADLESVLAKKGRPRPANRTPLEHAAALEREGFEGASLVRLVTEIYAHHRYADEPLSAANENGVRKALSELARR